MSTTDNQTTEIERLARNLLAEIAPDADVEGLDPGAAIQEELDLDSVDFLNYISGLYRATDVDIPERDYAEVATLAGTVAYVVEARRRSP